MSGVGSKLTGAMESAKEKIVEGSERVKEAVTGHHHDPTTTSHHTGTSGSGTGITGTGHGGLGDMPGSTTATPMGTGYGTTGTGHSGVTSGVTSGAGHGTTTSGSGMSTTDKAKHTAHDVAERTKESAAHVGGERGLRFACSAVGG